MWLTVTEVVGWSSCCSAHQSVTIINPAMIQMPIGLWTRLGPRNHVLDGRPDPPCEGAILSRKGAVHCKALCCELCKNGQPIETPFWLWTRVGPTNHALDGGAHWSHLANTTEPSMCGGYAAFLSNYSDHWLHLVQQRGPAWAGSLPCPFITVPNATAHQSRPVYQPQLSQ